MRPLTAFLQNHRWAVLITATYVVLAAAYNLSDPLFEAPDERLHYEYILELQETHRLPIVDLKGPLTEYHQPPLYYVIAAIISPRTQNEDLLPYTQSNPFWAYEIGQVGDDNKNQYLHPPESFPFTRTRRVVHQIRALSLLFGMVTVWTTYLLASRFVSRPLTLATVVVTAFVPNFLLTSGAITNDSLVIALSVTSTLFIIDLLDQADPPLVDWVILAGLLGLGMLTKLSFWPTLPASALAVVLLAIRSRSWRIFFVAGSLLLGGVALLGSWWVIRNWQLYGDVTGLSSMWAVWGIRNPLSLVDYVVEFRNFRATFWANFGYGNVPMPSWVYGLLDVASLGGLVGLSIRTVRFVRTGRPLPIILRDRLIVLGAWGFLTIVALVWYLQKTIAVTGRQAFTILPGIALVIVVGWSEFFRRKEHLVSVCISCGMGLLAVGALLGVLIPAYTPAPIISSEASEGRFQHPLDWQIGNSVNLPGYSLDVTSADPGEVVKITLFWEPLDRIGQNYTAFVHFFDPTGTQIGSRDTYPGLGKNPTAYWSSGQIIEDEIPVPISPNTNGPYLAEIEVGLYDLNTGERLPVKDSAGNTLGYPVIGHIKVNQIQPRQVSPQYELNIAFEQGIHLEGYSLSSSNPSPGDEFIVSLFWFPTEQPSKDYTVFVQLLNSEGQIVGQGDGMPRDGHYPTSAWQAGEHFEDHHRVSLPEEIRPGNYHIRIGFYDPVSGIRLNQVEGGDFVDFPHTIIVP